MQPTVDAEQAVVEKVLADAGYGDGAPVALDLLGVSAYHLVKVDHAERERRRAVGLGALMDRTVLRLLSSLPFLEPVLVASLPGRSQRMLPRLPDGVVEIQAGMVTRIVRPPLSLSCAVTVDTDADRGLDAASTFAQFCPRILLLVGACSDLAAVEVEASFYGIGLAVAQTQGVRLLVPPATMVARFGPASWRVREEAFAAFMHAAVDAA